MIPFSNTVKFRSNKIISAASFATSTAPATEIPTFDVCNEGASLIPSPIYPTT